MKFIFSLFALVPAALAVPPDGPPQQIPACGCQNSAGKWYSEDLCLLGRGAPVIPFASEWTQCYGTDDYANPIDRYITDGSCEKEAGSSDFKAVCNDVTVCKSWFTDELFSYKLC